MRFLSGALLGSFLFFSYIQNAEAIIDAATGQQVVEAEMTVEEALAEQQRQDQQAKDDAAYQMRSQANQAKQGLLGQRAAASEEMAACASRKNQADLEAERGAQSAEQQAKSQFTQQALNSVTGLVGAGVSFSGMGKAEAESNKTKAIQSYNSMHSQVSTSNPACVAEIGQQINPNGKNAKAVVDELTNAQLISHATGGTTATTCTNAKNALLAKARTVETTVRESDEVSAKSTQNLLALAATGAQLYMGNKNKNDQIEGAQQGLADSNSINKEGFDACTRGVLAKVKEIDRQLANIDAQLAGDLSRLNRQLASKRYTIPPSTLNRDDPGTDDGGGLQVGTLSNAGVNSNTGKLGAKGNPFDKFNKNDPNNGAGGGGGGGGGGQQAGGDDKPTWGFGDSLATNNSGMGQRLPDQPEKGGLVDGTGGGSGLGAGAGANPLDGLLGFEDPFANINGNGAGAALAEGSGNGFNELALRTKRRIIAHLQELLINPTTRPSAVVKTPANTPERKLSSTRN